MNTIQLVVAQPWVTRLGWTLIHFLWQGALIAALLAVARRLTEGARTRYLLACIALALMAGSPLLTFWLAGSGSGGETVAAAVPNQPIPGMFETYLSSPDLSLRLLPWLVAGWFAGVIAFSARLMGGWLAATRLRYTRAHDAPPEWQQKLTALAREMGVSRPVRILFSTVVEVPAVVGWLRPAIVAPAAALAGFPAEYLEALLAHELAHIRRHDFLVNILQSVVEAILFYHPAVWWVSQQIRMERELCCDDLAVASCGDVLTYARALAELESARPSRVPAMAANGGSLVRRVRRLLGPSESESHTLSGRGAASVASVLILLGIGIGAVAEAQNPGTRTGAEPSISRDAVWADTVMQGDLQIGVRALGVVSTSTTAQLTIPEAQMPEVKVGLPVTVEFRNPKALVNGRVTRLNSPASGSATAEIQFSSPQEAVAAGTPVDAIIDVATLSNVVYVGRPVSGQPNSEGALFKLDPDGRHANRVKVRFGRASVNKIQILGGLAPGDRIILSDTSPVDKYHRIVVQ